MRLQITDDCCATARRLIADDLDPSEMLEFCRGDMVCLRGKAGAFAKLCVVERDRGIIRHEPWTPIKDRNRRPRNRERAFKTAAPCST